MSTLAICLIIALPAVLAVCPPLRRRRPHPAVRRAIGGVRPIWRVCAPHVRTAGLLLSVLKEVLEFCLIVRGLL